MYCCDSQISGRKKSGFFSPVQRLDCVARSDLALRSKIGLSEKFLYFWSISCLVFELSIDDRMRRMAE